MSVFTRYTIELECLLTWFPLNSSAGLKAPVVIAKTYRYSSDDPPFVAGNAVINTIQRPEPLPDSAAAFVEVGVDQDNIFFVEIELQIGGAVRKRRLECRPDTTTPVMTHVSSNADDGESRDTALAFQSVILCGPRFNLVSSVVSDVFKGLRHR